MEAVDPTVFRIAIFVLAIFVGYYVVWSVTPALHTPVIVGALIAAATQLPLDQPTGSAWISRGMGAVAVALAAVNIFGGFLVTQRMLAMYKKKERTNAPTKMGGHTQ
jgi:H+-translocating NAD(P) transhydrogenase subunit alpha